MNINPDNFIPYLNQFTFSGYGDDNEKEYNNLLTNNFPRCELFWRYFVVPITKRIIEYPIKISSNIERREGINNEIEDIAFLHYSMFMNLIYAHFHLNYKKPPSLGNIYVHLGSVCDLAETILEKWYFLLSRCQNKKTTIFNSLSCEEYLVIAKKWYEKEYKKLYNYYLNKGKNQALYLPARDDVLLEYFGTRASYLNKYIEHTKTIRGFRNAIVHDVLIAKIVINDKTFIPKPSQINNYRSWREVFSVRDDGDIIRRDFSEQYQQAYEDLNELQRNLNNMWEILISDFQDEFFAKERSTLRKMFDIEFTQGELSPEVMFHKQQDDRPCTTSGRYNGSTLEYPWSNKNPDDGV